MKALLALAILLTLPGASLADYQPAKVYVIFLDSYFNFDELTGAEFAIENLPFDLCTITEYWNTNLIIGDPETGIALAFSPPLSGPLFVLGYLEFIAWEPVPDDYVITVVPSADGNLCVVDGDFILYEVFGGFHTFNCTDECSTWYCWQELGLWAEPQALNCWQDIEVFTTSAAENSWSAVKALY